MNPSPKPFHVSIGNIQAGNDLPFVLIAGPCQMESRAHALEVATALKEMCAKLGVPLIYKTSFDKANRTSVKGKRGMGLKEALPVFAEIKSSLGLPTLTDVHEIDQCAIAAEVIDVLQIPAFLCRQTDLLLAAGNTGAVINVKKGQFLAPWDMKNVADKVASTGNTKILLTERGVSFGYNTLVADMRSLPEMAKTGYPIVIDATHAVQQPGGAGASSGGQREFAPVIARAAVAVGVAAVFMETHPDPDKAPSDGPNMIHLKDMPAVIAMLKAFDGVAKANPVKI
jgi:2-dehydro-3-deoxyphosphooctonate aldolase (KDO 8-P synthase)